MQHQQSFDLDDNPSRPLDLDEEQHRLLISLMGEMVFHVFQTLRTESHEHTQESTKD
jgi:hypothetical protein